ncbi:hypothetical protein C3L21_35440 (plasmid) [Sinorhizobium meliloti]|nr:hypothetical protein [Sinorhizobium meliloti]QGJ79105.1 hypothetical protein C3L21_35440 [Sinorhizobium meliloti]
MTEAGSAERRIFELAAQHGIAAERLLGRPEVVLHNAVGDHFSDFAGSRGILCGEVHEEGTDYPVRIERATRVGAHVFCKFGLLSTRQCVVETLPPQVLGKICRFGDVLVEARIKQRRRRERFGIPRKLDGALNEVFDV